MRNLFDLIGKLTKEEKRHFKIYLQRIKQADGEHRLITLFDLVNDGICQTDDALNGRLYPHNTDKNAYYRLKNRLIADLERSLLLLHVGMNDRVEIMSQISMAQIYYFKALYKDAYELLKKAERNAEKGDHTDLLAVIYELIVKMAFDFEPIDLKNYSDKQLNNLTRYQNALQTDRLIKNLSYRLLKSNFNVRDTHLNTTLEEIRETLSIQTELLESPKMQFDISNTIRRILLQKEDYDGLEAYLIENLRDFETKQLYKKETHVHKIISLIWLVNTLLKNRKFKAMNSYTALLHEALLAYNKLYYEKYIWIYYQSLISQYFYSNELVHAIDLLNSLSNERHSSGATQYDMFVYGNLSVAYYCAQQLRKAMSSLAPLLQREVFGKLSVELQLRVRLLEVILHYENSDFDFIDYKISEIRHAYKTLLQQGTYSRESAFIRLFKRCIAHPKPFSDATIRQRIADFVQESPPFAPSSNEFISYRLWFESKLNKVDYYELVLRRV